MIALYTITAAIVKLEGLKAESTPGPWLVEEIPETGESRLIREFEFFGPQTVPLLESVASGGMLAQDANLIVVLQNTLDAQLAILRAAQDDYTQYGGKPSKFFANDVMLARAILGEATHD